MADICFSKTALVIPQPSFKANSELECSLSSDMVRMSHFCRQWRLKPSASKTIGSLFHLHNTSATRELSVYLDGWRIRHECPSTYLWVTLDPTLSYTGALVVTHAMLRRLINCRFLLFIIITWQRLQASWRTETNNLIKLAGSTWGTSANTLRSSALALCYLAAEYCASVWSCSAHTSQVDVQLNSTMHLVSGTFCSTTLPWLPVLSNIELPALRRKAATDKLVEKIVKHDSWPIQPDILNPLLLQLTSSLTHHCYDWHPRSCCGWTCN